MTPQLVSVVMPCYNQGRYLAQAIESVLGQTHPCVELIVIDDGSEDNAAEVARAYGSRIRFFRQENQGRSIARNRGLDEARGQFIKFLDADDKLNPECLARQVGAMGPETPWNESATRSFEDNSSETTPHFACQPDEPLWRRLLFQGGVPSCAPLVRAEVTADIRFRTGLEWGEDTIFWSDVWVKVGHPVRMPFVDGAVCLVRSHPMQTHTRTTQRDVLRFISELVRTWEEHFIPEHPWVARECVDRLSQIGTANINSSNFDRALHRRTIHQIRAFSRRHGLSSLRPVIHLQGRRWERHLRSLSRSLRSLVRRNGRERETA